MAIDTIEEEQPSSEEQQGMTPEEAQSYLDPNKWIELRSGVKSVVSGEAEPMNLDYRKYIEHGGWKSWGMDEDRSIPGCKVYNSNNGILCRVDVPAQTPRSLSDLYEYHLTIAPATNDTVEALKLLGYEEAQDIWVPMSSGETFEDKPTQELWQGMITKAVESAKEPEGNSQEAEDGTV